MKSKKAQVWSLDVVVASIIFLTGVMVLFVYAVNFNSQAKSSLDEMFYEGNLASELMMSDNEFGILVDNRVDNLLADGFNCGINRPKMGLRHEFYFTLDGTPGVLCSPPTGSTDNLIKITRVVVIESSINPGMYKPAKLEVFIYD